MKFKFKAIFMLNVAPNIHTEKWMTQVSATRSNNLSRMIETTFIVLDKNIY